MLTKTNATGGIAHSKLHGRKEKNSDKNRDIKAKKIDSGAHEFFFATYKCLNIRIFEIERNPGLEFWVNFCNKCGEVEEFS